MRMMSRQKLKIKSNLNFLEATILGIRLDVVGIPGLNHDLSSMLLDPILVTRWSEKIGRFLINNSAPILQMNSR